MNNNKKIKENKVVQYIQYDIQFDIQFTTNCIAINRRGQQINE